MVKFSLQHQLIAAFGLLALFVLAVGLTGVTGVNTLGGVFNQYQDSAQGSVLVNEMKLDLQTARNAAFNWRTTNDNAESLRTEVSRFLNTVRAA